MTILVINVPLFMTVALHPMHGIEPPYIFAFGSCWIEAWSLQWAL